MHIIYGILGVVAGILYIKYSPQITHASGSFGWAEKYLGSGGTYTMHKLIGVLLIVISILSMTGTFQVILRSTIGRLFPGL